MRTKGLDLWSSDRAGDTVAADDGAAPAPRTFSSPFGGNSAWRPRSRKPTGEDNRGVTKGAAHGPRPGRHLRHHPARRRAVAGDLAEHDREARDRAPARAAGRRRDRGRLPDRLAGRLRGGARDRPRGPGAGDRRPGARSCGRHRARRRGGTRRGATSDPHVHLDVGHPHRAPAAVHARGRQGPGARGGRARAVVRRRRRVLADGRDARRRRVHRRGAADRARRGRDDDQHPRHRRLRDAARVRRVPDDACTSSCRGCAASCCPSTATTTSGWRWRTRSPACRPARARSSARSTGSASARATRRSRRS